MVMIAYLAMLALVPVLFMWVKADSVKSKATQRLLSGLSLTLGGVLIFTIAFCCVTDVKHTFKDHNVVVSSR